MPTKYSTSTMLNASLVSDIVNRADARMVKGQKTSSDSALGIMGRGYKYLSSKGITNNLNPNVSDNDFAAALLSTLGCSICTETKESTGHQFTLLSQQTDTQEIQNENILDLSSFSDVMAAEYIIATDKFPNDSSDPFFTLDEAPETALSQQAKQASTIKIIDLQDLTATIIDINLSNTGTTLKQFK